MNFKNYTYLKIIATILLGFYLSLIIQISFYYNSSNLVVFIMNIVYIIFLVFFIWFLNESISFKLLLVPIIINIFTFLVNIIVATNFFKNIQINMIIYYIIHIVIFIFLIINIMNNYQYNLIAVILISLLPFSLLLQKVDKFNGFGILTLIGYYISLVIIFVLGKISVKRSSYKILLKLKSKLDSNIISKSKFEKEKGKLIKYI